MIVYKLYNANFERDIIPYGIDHPSNASEKKLAIGLNRIKPFLHCIPFFNDTEFAFRGLNELKTFLFNYCDLDEHDIEELDNCGWEIKQFNCDSIVNGLSNMILAYFTDSISEPISFKLDNFYDSQYKVIKELEYPKDEVMFVYNTYFKKKGIKF